jgi:murein DD-endopeptidase MepM/ murein hydrolase activator NlpD
MILEKGFSLLFVPHKNGKVLEVKISYRILVLLLVGLFLLLSSSLFLLWNASERAYDKLRLSRLEKENRYLTAKQEELNSVIFDLKGQMAELIDKEKQVRMVFGLPEVDDQIRKLGVGGPVANDPVKIGPGAQRANLAEIELDKLLRQARFEKDNFEQIYASLVDRKEVLDHTPSIRPSAGYLSCGFGMRIDPFTGKKQFHRGVDLAADIGTPVHATADGVVRSVRRDVGLGKLIQIDHLHGYSTVYAHLSRISVKRGQHVERGDVIGGVGNTGYSTGPHLHYEVRYQGRAQNPYKYFLSNEYVLD